MANSVVESTHQAMEHEYKILPRTQAFLMLCQAWGGNRKAIADMLTQALCRGGDLRGVTVLEAAVSCPELFSWTPQNSASEQLQAKALCFSLLQCLEDTKASPLHAQREGYLLRFKHAVALNACACLTAEDLLLEGWNQLSLLDETDESRIQASIAKSAAVFRLLIGTKGALWSVHHLVQGKCWPLMAALFASNVTVISIAHVVAVDALGFVAWLSKHERVDDHLQDHFDLIGVALATTLRNILVRLQDNSQSHKALRDELQRVTLHALSLLDPLDHTDVQNWLGALPMPRIAAFPTQVALHMLRQHARV
eukprot:m.67524 g.67524  ORF g.67524 m.67524 type:complete len:310 (+) comp49976_c0_seq1:1408-2337(+)